MGRIIRAAFWLLTAFLFAYDIVLWGGLAVTPGVGPELRSQASLQSPIAATYLFTGRHVVLASGRARAATEFSGKRFHDQIADVEAPRIGMLARFLSAQSSQASFAYYGAPILLVLSLVLHMTRQRQIRSFGRKA